MEEEFRIKTKVSRSQTRRILFGMEQPPPLGGDTTGRNGIETVEGGPNGGRRSRLRDCFATRAIALTPRREDLIAGFWARDPSLRRLG